MPNAVHIFDKFGGVNYYIITDYIRYILGENTIYYKLTYKIYCKLLLRLTTRKESFVTHRRLILKCL